jgi:hypothetical protein
VTSAFYYRKFGGPTLTTGEPLLPHDFIELSLRTKGRIISKCAPLYENGLSLRDIEERTGIPKNTIRNTFISNGVALRSFSNANIKGRDRTKAKLGGNTPYGYACHDGKLVIDPREQVAIRLMVKLSKSGRSFQYIADELNRKKILTRNGGQWRRQVINVIVKNK